MATIIGLGFDLLVSPDGTTYTSVGSVIDIDTPDWKCGDVDISYLQMSGTDKLFMAAMGDGGQAEFTLLFDKAKYNTLFGYRRTSKYWKILASDSGSTWVWQGYINSLPKAKVEMEKEFCCPVGIKVSGAITFTAGS